MCCVLLSWVRLSYREKQMVMYIYKVLRDKPQPYHFFFYTGWEKTGVLVTIDLQKGKTQP